MLNIISFRPFTLDAQGLLLWPGDREWQVVEAAPGGRLKLLALTVEQYIQVRSHNIALASISLRRRICLAASFSKLSLMNCKTIVYFLRSLRLSAPAHSVIVHTRRRSVGSILCNHPKDAGCGQQHGPAVRRGEIQPLQQWLCPQAVQRRIFSTNGW